MKAYVLYFAWMLSLPTAGQVIINELMQSNVDCVMDDMNEFSDSWVELYNTSTNALTLGKYKLGANSDASNAWQLPDTVIGPHDYVLVYCDNVGKGLHTDFRLESGNGCEVYLFRHGEVVDKVVGLKKQPAPNIAYGRETDGADTWGYLNAATPHAENCGELARGILGDVIFSERGRVMTDAVTITLSLSIPEGSPVGTVIRFTLDGTEPTSESTTYHEPLQIGSTCAVRAKMFCDGWLSPRSTTHSFIFFPNNRPLTLPVVSIVTDGRYLYDSKTGIYVEGTYEQGKHNYEHDWRRPINFEYFKEAGYPSVLNQLCEMRVMGGASRMFKVKSLVIYAHKRFGKKRLDYEFFPDQRPGVTDFKSVALRNAGNDYDGLYMRDAIIQRTMAQHVDLDWQAWQPAILYLNGEYVGMLNIRERSNEKNIYTHYDGLEDIDMVENWHTLKEGDMEEFMKFKDFYAKEGHTLAEYAEYIDWEEYINLMSMNLFYNNQDFPSNNTVMWRPKTVGGKWRFIAKDADFGLGMYGSSPRYESVAWLYDPQFDAQMNWGNSENGTLLFRRMMEDEDFRREFIDRTAIYMGDFMNERGTRAVWDGMYEEIKTEYPFFRDIVDKGRTWRPTYAPELRIAREWMAQRTDFFYQHLSDYFHLGDPVPLKVNYQTDAGRIPMNMNGVKLSEGMFDGQFFIGRKVTLEGVPSEGIVVKEWKVDILDNDSTERHVKFDGGKYEFVVPQCLRMNITAVLGEASGLETAFGKSWEWKKQGDHLVVRGVPSGVPIALYDTLGWCVCRGVSDGDDIQLPLWQCRKAVVILRVGGDSAKIVVD